MKHVTGEFYFPVDSRLISRLSGILLFIGIIMVSAGLGCASGLYINHNVPDLPFAHFMTWFVTALGIAVTCLSQSIYERTGWFR